MIGVEVFISPQFRERHWMEFSALIAPGGGRFVPRRQSSPNKMKNDLAGWVSTRYRLTMQTPESLCAIVSIKTTTKNRGELFPPPIVLWWIFLRKVIFWKLFPKRKNEGKSKTHRRRIWQTKVADGTCTSQMNWAPDAEQFSRIFHRRSHPHFPTHTSETRLFVKERFSLDMSRRCFSKIRHFSPEDTPTEEQCV